MSCGGTQAQFAVRRRGKVRFVRFDQKRQSLTRFVAAPFSHKTPRTTLRFAGALRYPQASADLSAKPTKEQAPNALDNQHLAQGGMSKGVSPFDGFWFLFSIEKKLALTAVGGYAINNRKNEIYYKDLKKGKTNMLKVENNRFYYGGISFPVPNGLYIHSCPPFIPQNGLAVYSEDRSICIALCFCEYEEPTPLYMDNVGYNNKDYLTMPITKYDVNDITWYCRIFTYKKTQMFEA